MKKLRNLVLIVSLVLVFSMSIVLLACNFSADEEPFEAQDHRFLTADGVDFVNANGEKVFLKGINAGGLFVQEEWMCPVESKDTITTYNTLISRFGYDRAMALIKAYQDAWWTEEDFDNVKELGFNLIRLPFAYFNLENESGELVNFEKMDWFIDNCDKRDLYVILDLHGAYGSQNGKDHSGDTSKIDLFGNKENEEKTIELWRTVAERYKNRSIIAGYDLLNEPEGKHGYTNFVQWRFYNELYEAIREVDSNHVIIMEAVWETNALPSPSMLGWKNVAYSYHNYGWDDINNFEYQKAFTDKKIADYLKTRKSYKVPFFVGEFTLFGNVESWHYALNAYESNNVNYAMWTYKVHTGGKDSSWGIYCGGGEKVLPESDSYDVILEKWSGESTLNSYEYNKLYNNILNQGE